MIRFAFPINKGTGMTVIKLDKRGYPERNNLPRWLVAAHIAGLLICAYAINYA